MGSMRVGTSGWGYKHWEGAFYPEHTPSAKRLAYYAEQFPTVEINATFYRLPSEKTVRSWHDTVPADFRFAVKGSRYITHHRRLSGVADAVEAYMTRLDGLGTLLEVVLWQLPPGLDRDDRLLEEFLSMLPGGVRHAIEFRNTSWLEDAVFDILQEHGTAHVNVDSTRMPRNLTVTGDFVYVRFHGPASGSGYTTHDLKPWRRFLREQAEAGRDGYVYFNNDFEAHAPRDAKTLIAMLDEVAYEWGEHGAGGNT